MSQQQPDRTIDHVVAAFGAWTEDTSLEEMRSGGDRLFPHVRPAVGARAARAGLAVTLDEWPGQIHVWQIFARRLDEGQQAIEQLGALVREHTG